MGEKEQEVTIQEQGGIHLEIIFTTKALVHLYFYAYIKKSNEVIKLRPAQKASCRSMHSYCNPQSSAIILQIIK